MLSAEDIEAVIGLLKMIAGWLDNASPVVRDELHEHLRGTEDLPARIAWFTAMLRYRQIEEGTR